MLLHYHIDILCNSLFLLLDKIEENGIWIKLPINLLVYGTTNSYEE